MSQTRRSITIAELLSPAQCTQVDRIITEIRDGHTPLNSLRVYLRTRREALAAKEADADYIFYALSYAYGLR